MRHLRGRHLAGPQHDRVLRALRRGRASALLRGGHHTCGRVAVLAVPRVRGAAAAQGQVPAADTAATLGHDGQRVQPQPAAREWGGGAGGAVGQANGSSPSQLPVSGGGGALGCPGCLCLLL